MEETTGNKFHIQSPDNIYISHHLQRRGHIVSAALQAAQLAVWAYLFAECKLACRVCCTTHIVAHASHDS